VEVEKRQFYLSVMRKIISLEISNPNSHTFSVGGYYSTTKRGSIQKLSSFLSSTLHHNSSQENQSQNKSNSSSSTAVQLEFDQIDVISRELRQRVLLIQFLKEFPFSIIIPLDR
jgi:hypothetical protein